MQYLDTFTSNLDEENERKVEEAGIVREKRNYSAKVLKKSAL